MTATGIRPRRAMRIQLGGSLVLVGMMSVAHAASWPPDGQAIATQGIPPNVPSCVSCHGASLTGDREAGVPSLRGKAAADLMDDLYAMAQNPRDHSAMASIARHLDMAQRSAVTAYLARLTAKPK